MEEFDIMKKKFQQQLKVQLEEDPMLPSLTQPMVMLGDGKKLMIIQEMLREQFKQQILTLIQANYQPAIVAKYSYEFYLDNDIKDERLEFVVDYLKGMDASPEFELGRDGLINFLKESLGGS